MHKNIKTIIGVIVAIAVIWGGYVLANKPGAQTTKEPIKIGVATILSGDIAAFGENLVNVARMEVDEINKNGGINGHKVELVIEDAKCDSKTGLAAVEKLVNVDKVSYIIGGMCSNGILAAAPVVNNNKIVMLVPSTGGKNVDESGEYVFRIGNSDLLVGRDVASTMAKKGYKNVGVIAEKTEYATDIKKSFEQKAQELGMNVVIAEEFQPNTTDFKTIVAKMKNEKIDAVLVASQTGISGGNLIKQIRTLGLDMPIFSDFLLVFNGDVAKIIGSLDGIYYADPSYGANDKEVSDFFSAYEAKYGIKPLAPYFSAGTYDSIQLITTAIKAAGDDSQKVHDWILGNVKNHTGFMGTYSLDQNGNSDAGFVIKYIENGMPVEVH